MSLIKLTLQLSADSYPLANIWYVQNGKRVASVALVENSFTRTRRWEIFWDDDGIEQKVASAEHAEKLIIKRYGTVAESHDCNPKTDLKRWLSS